MPGKMTEIVADDTVAIELGHERLGGRIVNLPQAGHRGSRAGHLEGPLQAQDAFAAFDQRAAGNHLAVVHHGVLQGGDPRNVWEVLVSQLSADGVFHP